MRIILGYLPNINLFEELFEIIVERSDAFSGLNSSDVANS